MSIKLVQGSILDVQGGVVCHQVNCKGVMGAGLAKQIRARNPDTYARYRSHCGKHTDKQLLGTVLFTNAEQSNIDYIANCFGQLGFGTRELQTDYEALRSCMNSVREFAIQRSIAVHIPYGIGCGLAGGDWAKVSAILVSVFEGFPVDVFVWKLCGLR